MSELKPCPFCGSTSLTIDSKSKRVGSNGLGERVENHSFSVRCNKCHARGATAGGRVAPYRMRGRELAKWEKTDEELREKAIEAWNRRVKDD